MALHAEACSLRGGCLGVAPSNGSERLSHSQQQTFDLNQVPGVMKVGSNTTLSLVNLHLANVAYKTSYKRTDAQPFRTEGVGTGLWPSVQFSPDSKVGPLILPGIPLSAAVVTACHCLGVSLLFCP